MRLGNDSRTLTLPLWPSYPPTAIGRHKYCSVPYRAQLSKVLGLSALVPPPQRMPPHMDPLGGEWYDARGRK